MYNCNETVLSFGILTKNCLLLFATHKLHMAKTRVVKPALSKKFKHKPKNKHAKSKKTIGEPPAAKDIRKEEMENEANVKAEDKKVVVKDLSTEELAEKYPIFRNEELVKKFLGVTMTNNQKGRVRQTLRDSLKGTSEMLLPDVIHNRILAISKASNLTDAELRKIKILYNMLKTTLQTEKTVTKVTKKKNRSRMKKINKDSSDNKEEALKETTQDVEINNVETVDKVKDTKDVKLGNDKTDKKVKGPKRYVVFIGNLPLDIDKEKIMQHFSEFSDYIVDVRIPNKIEGKKSSIAYLELKNEPSYELALSKHHSMLGSKRINVLYTTQKNTKITKAEAKGKAAKLIALQKSGKLMGSVPANRKRSHRRMKAKRAKAALEAEAGN